VAQRGSVGSLSVRATGFLTCPADGWVTLGAGNRAQGPARVSGVCPERFPFEEPQTAGAIGARLVEQVDLTARNARQSFGARPGALADGVSCVSAVGRAGAAAGAHPIGRIDRYVSALPENPGPLLSSCPVTVIGLDSVTGGNPETRRADVLRLDAAVAAVDESRPASSVLMVLGVADTELPPRLHVAVIDGPGYGRRWLTSSSTGREPYVQLIDVTPTIFAALKVAQSPVLAGQPMRAGGARPADLDTAVERLVDADLAAKAQRPLVQPFLTALVVLNLGFLGLILVLIRWRARRLAALAPPRPVPFGVSPRRLLEYAAIGLAALLPASYLANAVPWWRLPAGRLVHICTIVALAAVLTLLAFAGRWGKQALGPPALIATVVAVVLGLDVVLGSSLQLNSVAGYSPLVAGRFTGFGNLAFAVFAAGALLATGYLTRSLRGRARTIALVCAAVGGVLVVGAPGWGGDVGGVIAITPAFTILVLRASGIRLSLLTALAAGGLGAVAIAMFALLDYARPPEERTHLGRFVAQWSDGTAGTVLRRKAEANLSLLIDSQLTLLVIAVLIFVPLVLLRRSGGLRRVFGLYPTVRAAMIGVVVVAVIGFAVNDSGVAVPAFVAALAVPLAVCSTLRVRADARRGIPVSTAEAARYVLFAGAGGHDIGEPDPIEPLMDCDEQDSAVPVSPAIPGRPAERQEDADR
jgi:hypothetical protein